MTTPEAETGDDLREKFLMVQKLLKLPIREDSSAIQRMDGWEIADFIAAHTRRAVLLGNLKELDRLTAYDKVDTEILTEVRRRIKKLQKELTD